MTSIYAIMLSGDYLPSLQACLDKKATPITDWSHADQRLFNDLAQKIKEADEKTGTSLWTSLLAHIKDATKKDIKTLQDAIKTDTEQGRFADNAVEIELPTSRAAAREAVEEKTEETPRKIHQHNRFLPYQLHTFSALSTLYTSYARIILDSELIGEEKSYEIVQKLLPGIPEAQYGPAGTAIADALAYFIFSHVSIELLVDLNAHQTPELLTLLHQTIQAAQDKAAEDFRPVIADNLSMDESEPADLIHVCKKETVKELQRLKYEKLLSAHALIAQLEKPDAQTIFDDTTASFDALQEVIENLVYAIDWLAIPPVDRGAFIIQDEGRLHAVFKKYLAHPAVQAQYGAAYSRDPIGGLIPQSSHPGKKQIGVDFRHKNGHSKTVFLNDQKGTLVRKSKKTALCSLLETGQKSVKQTYFKLEENGLGDIYSWLAHAHDFSKPSTPVTGTRKEKTILPELQEAYDAIKKLLKPETTLPYPQSEFIWQMWENILACTDSIQEEHLETFKNSKQDFFAKFEKHYPGEDPSLRYGNEVSITWESILQSLRKALQPLSHAEAEDPKQDSTSSATSSFRSESPTPPPTPPAEEEKEEEETKIDFSSSHTSPRSLNSNSLLEEKLSPVCVPSQQAATDIPEHKLQDDAVRILSGEDLQTNIKIDAYKQQHAAVRALSGASLACAIVGAGLLAASLAIPACGTAILVGAALCCALAIALQSLSECKRTPPDHVGAPSLWLRGLRCVVPGINVPQSAQLGTYTYKLEV